MSRKTWVLAGVAVVAAVTAAAGAVITSGGKLDSTETRTPR